MLAQPVPEIKTGPSANGLVVPPNMKTSFFVCLLLVVSAVAALEVSEDADLEVADEQFDDINALSEADASNLSDEEVESLQEQFRIYGRYCGAGLLTR